MVGHVVRLVAWAVFLAATCLTLAWLNDAEDFRLLMLAPQMLGALLLGFALCDRIPEAIAAAFAPALVSIPFGEAELSPMGLVFDQVWLIPFNAAALTIGMLAGAFVRGWWINRTADTAPPSTQADRVADTDQSFAEALLQVSRSRRPDRDDEQ